MNTGSFLQLISIVIAINALVTAFFVWIINKDKSLLEKSVKELVRHINYTESVIESLIEWLIMHEKVAKIDQGWLYKHMNYEEGMEYFNNHKENIKSALQQLSQCRDHMMLHSPDENRKESAYKTLTNASGDIDSYNLMIRLFRLDKKEKLKYNVYAVALKNRLKNK